MTKISSSIRLILVSLLVFSPPVPASARDGRGLSLRECMEYAIARSTNIRIQDLNVDDARIARRDALLSAFTPQVNVSTAASYNFGRNIDPQTNTYFTQTSFHNSYGLSTGFDLFDGFKAVNNVRISRTSLLISQSTRQQVEASLCLAVMEAYYNVVYYDRLAEVCAEQVATAETALRRVKRQEELGQKGHADVVQLEADLADQQYELTRTQNTRANKLTDLADLMFWPVDEELTLDDQLPGEEEVGLPEAADGVVAFALGHDPQLRIAGWEADNARRQLSLARWQMLPSVGVYAGWSTNYYTYLGTNQTRSFRDQFVNNGGEYLQMSLSFPIFSRSPGRSNLARRRNALERATTALDRKRREVESEVRRAVLDRDNAASAYRMAHGKAAVQAEAYALNRQRLEQGLISPLEFRTANSNYLKARADEMNSLFSYLIKQAVVRYYGGEAYINQLRVEN